MLGTFQFVRRSLSVALTLLFIFAAGSSFANPKPFFAVSTSGSAVIVEGVSEIEIDKIISDPNLVRLQTASTPRAPSMMLQVLRHQKGFVVKPQFKLLSGTVYDLSVKLPHRLLRHQFQLEKAKCINPRLQSFSPSQSTIPANTLRFYLTFSEPMKRGDANKAIHLETAEGLAIPNPFLNLATELWDHSQKRLTYFLDPGRIKKGVGPHVSHGSPLQVGKTYHLKVASTMRSVRGCALQEDTMIKFHVGTSIETHIDINEWHFASPKANSREPLVISFDRVMDRFASIRMIALESDHDSKVGGRVFSDGGSWSLTPINPWQRGSYRILIDPNLEDLAGNNFRSAFDAPAGTIDLKTMGTEIEQIHLPMRITD